MSTRFKVLCLSGTIFLEKGDTYEAEILSNNNVFSTRVADAYDGADLSLGVDYAIYKVGDAGVIGYYSASKFERAPTIPTGTLVKYNNEAAGHTYRITGSQWADGVEWVTVEGVSPSVKGWSHDRFNCFRASDWTVIQEDTPVAGDRVEVSITAEVTKVYHNGSMTLRSDQSGAFYVNAADINGRPKVLKAKPQPVKAGQILTHGGRSWTVETLLDNDWFVCRESFTDSNYKLGHKNDPSFVRQS